MIQITGIPMLNPYRRAAPDPGFVACPHCKGLYASAYRSIFCPHPIVPARQLTAGRNKNAQLVVRTRKPTGPRAPIVLKEPYYDQQLGEHPKRYQAFRLWISLSEKRSFAAVSTQLRKSPQLISRWAREDKWPVRLQAYDRDQAAERRAIEKKLLKKDTEDMLKLVRARGRTLAVELTERMKMIERGELERMSNSELDRALEGTIKLYRLLQDQSTENVMTDTPEMKRERSFRDAVLDTRQSILEWQGEHPDATPEEIEAAQRQYIEWGVEFYPAVDRDQLAAAIMGSVDESSTASN